MTQVDATTTTTTTPDWLMFTGFVSNSSLPPMDDENGTLHSTVIEWDDWDRTMWTPEQRRLIEVGVVPREIYITLGVALSLIVLFGIAANATILYVFSRFKRLRTPANVFIINLTTCDLMACLLHPLAVYSSFRGRWSFGRTGCNIYGMGVAFFGLNSIITLSAIACERYIVITSTSCRPVVAKWRITRRQAQRVCIGIWLHCAALVTPPWLFEWSHYQPEGVLVTCSWDYTSRTLSNRLYYVYLLVLGFVIPVGVLTFCYSAIFRFIVRSSREMTRLIMTSDGRMSMSKTTISFRQRRRQTDIRTALIILSLAVACFTAWTPYAVVSMIGQFAPLGPNDGDDKMRLSPLTTSVPAFLAKTAIVFDPIVYGFSHPQFRSSVRQILNQYSTEHSSVNGAGTRPGGQNATTLMMMSRVPPGHPSSVRSVRYSSIAGQGSSFINRSRASVGQITPSPQFKLVANGSVASIARMPHRRGGSITSKPLYRRKSSVGAGSRRRLGSGSSGTGRKSSLSCSASLAEETSNASIRLMMLQEESEFYLFRQQQSQAEQENRAAKRERMIQLLSLRRSTATAAGCVKRRASEPDLLRCSDRVIPNATLLSWDDYRHKRSDYIRSVFFRSAGHLPDSSRADVAEPVLPIVPVRDKSPARASRSSLGITERYQVANSRLSLRIQQLDGHHHHHQHGAVRTSPSSSSGRSAPISPAHCDAGRLSHSAVSSAAVSPNYSQHGGKRSPRSGVHHEDCCECAYRSLSETVTLSRRNGDAQWRPCMMSGRDTLSCSVNSP